jgi:hypothetical protein
MPPKPVWETGAPPTATQPTILTLRGGRDPDKAPIRRDSTQIINQKKVPSTLTELRGNPLLSKTKKKSRLYIYYIYI